MKSVEKCARYVENAWKSGVFSWKSKAVYVEKIWSVEKQRAKEAQTIEAAGFWGATDKRKKLQQEYGKDKEKIFSDVEKYVESVTKRVKSSFSALWRRKMLEFANHI